MSSTNQAFVDGKQAERVTAQSEKRSNSSAKISFDKRKMRWIGILAVFMLIVWFIPLWLITTRNENQYKAAQRELNQSKLQNLIASAMVDAGRGEYEPARQTASDFFTAIRTQIDAGESSVFSSAQRESLKPLLQERDEIITLLARSDSAATERLTQIYLTYRQAVSNALPSQIKTSANMQVGKGHG
jgi:hypothetical protein